MKINELLNSFSIFITNEEQELLDKMEGIKPMELYSERDQFVIENLVRKSLITKILRNRSYMVMKNEQTSG